MWIWNVIHGVSMQERNVMPASQPKSKRSTREMDSHPAWRGTASCATRTCGFPLIGPDKSPACGECSGRPLSGPCFVPWASTVPSLKDLRTQRLPRAWWTCQPSSLTKAPSAEPMRLRGPSSKGSRGWSDRGLKLNPSRTSSMSTGSAICHFGCPPSDVIVVLPAWLDAS